jgi:hypothetical protein
MLNFAKYNTTANMPATVAICPKFGRWDNTTEED